MGRAMRHSGLLICVVFAMSAAAMGPPPGPRNIALCPVTGINMTLTAETPVVHFANGQVLYFATEEAANKSRGIPRDFWLSPHDLPLPGMDGKRGLPDLRSEK